MPVIEYMDGFDDYAAADATLWGWDGPWTSMQAGRVTGQKARLTNATRTRSLNGDIRYTIGFAWWISNSSWGADITRLLENGTLHGLLKYNGDGTFSILRGTTVMATSPNQGIASGIAYHLELDYNCHDTTGSYELRLNETPIIGPTTGVDTRNGGAAGTLNQLTFVSQSGLNQDFDDLMITKGGGFNGDCRVITSLSNADGANTAWIASAGADYTCVDEATPNADTDYISSSTPGDRDTFSYPALGVVGVVKAVMVCAVARKDDAGTRLVAPVIRRGGTNYDGTAVALGTGYAGLAQVYEQDPSTAAAWTVANVDAGEYGSKLDT